MWIMKLSRNDLRALHALIIASAPAGDCGWTPAACKIAQMDHDRVDDCLVHPWITEE